MQSASTRPIWWVDSTTVWPAAGAVADDADDEARADRIEARQRLVENRRWRAGESVAAICTFCWLPFESCSTFLPAASARSRRSSQSRRFRPRVAGGVIPLSVPRYSSTAPTGCARIQAALFGQVSDAVAVRRLKRPSEHLDPAGCRA